MIAKKIGVIGGGQLAWMMGLIAPKLGLELIIQTPNIDDPAVSGAKDVVLAAIADEQATAKLAKLTDAITFENEFINLKALLSLENQGVVFRPSLTALLPLLDKYVQRSYLQSIDVPVPNFALLEKPEDLHGFSSQTFPLVLKARRHGYDGQGTFIVKNVDELTNVWQKYNCPSMLIEEFVPFQKELAIMVARNTQGEIVTYPVVETFQQEQVCRQVIAPAEISESISNQAQAIAKNLVTELEFVGILGIEFFLTSSQKLLVNEIAPRTHNSGHYSLDACDISQFEMQLRAVANLPITEPIFKAKTALMVNLLGYEVSQSDYQAKRTKIAQFPHTFVHWYGKKGARPGRKMGHVTVLFLDNYVQAKEIACRIEAIWNP